MREASENNVQQRVNCQILNLPTATICFTNRSASRSTNMLRGEVDIVPKLRQHAKQVHQHLPETSGLRDEAESKRHILDRAYVIPASFYLPYQYSVQQY